MDVEVAEIDVAACRAVAARRFGSLDERWQHAGQRKNDKEEECLENANPSAESALRPSAASTGIRGSAKREVAWDRF